MEVDAEVATFGLARTIGYIAFKRGQSTSSSGLMIGGASSHAGTGWSYPTISTGVTFPAPTESNKGARRRGTGKWQVVKLV